MTQHIDLRLKKYATFSKQAEFELLAEISVGGLKVPEVNTFWDPLCIELSELTQ